MVTKQAIIQNSAGIHCRPSAVIVRAFADYEGTLCAETKNGRCDLRSVLDLIALGMDAGTEVTLTVTGPNEEETCQKLVDLFEFKFDFPPNN